MLELPDGDPEYSLLDELSYVLELPAVELEAAKAVWHIMVHIVTLRTSAKNLFFTFVTSFLIHSKLANFDLSKQAPKTCFNPNKPFNFLHNYYVRKSFRPVRTIMHTVRKGSDSW